MYDSIHIRFQKMYRQLHYRNIARRPVDLVKTTTTTSITFRVTSLPLLYHPHTTRYPTYSRSITATSTRNTTSMTNDTDTDRHHISNRPPNRGKYAFSPTAIYDDAPTSSTPIIMDKNSQGKSMKTDRIHSNKKNYVVEDDDDMEWYIRMNPTNLHVKYHMKNQYVQKVGQQILSLPKSKAYIKFLQEFQHQQRVSPKNRNDSNTTNKRNMLRLDDDEEMSSSLFSYYEESVPPIFYEMEYGTTMKLLRTVLDRRVERDHNYIPNISEIHTPFTIPTINIVFQLLERVYTEFTMLDLAYTQALKMSSSRNSGGRPSSIRRSKHEIQDPKNITIMLQNYIQDTYVYRNFYTSTRNINRLLHIWKELSVQQIQFYRSLSSNGDENKNQYRVYIEDTVDNISTISRIIRDSNPITRQRKAVANEIPIVSLKNVLSLLQYMSQYAMQPQPHTTTTLNTKTNKRSNDDVKASFQFDTGTLGILLQVLTEQLPSKYSAPLDVHEFIQTYYCDSDNHKIDDTTTTSENNCNESTPTTTTTTTMTMKSPMKSSSSSFVSKVLPSDIYIYSIVMKVWAGSNRPETSQKLMSLLEEMRTEHKIRPNDVIYGILLRYYASKNDVDQLKVIYHSMEYIDLLPPNLTCYAQVVYGYTKCHQIAEARVIFAKMILALQKDSNNQIRKSTPLLMSSAQNIIDAYRRSIESYGSKHSSMSNSDFQVYANSVLNDAEAFVRKLESTGILVLDDKFGDRIRGTMMDMYARIGTSEKLQETEAIFNTMIQPDTVAYGILIKAYRKNNRADLADDMFQEKLLKDPNVPQVSINLFNALICAWAESTLPNAVERGLQVLRLIEKINRIQRYHKRKNQILTHGNAKYLNELQKNRVTIDDFIMNNRKPDDDKNSNYKRWEQRQHRNKSKKDTKLLESITSDSTEHDIIPNTDTYTGLLKCCADAGDGITFPADMGRKIEGLLLQMEHRIAVPNGTKRKKIYDDDTPIEQKIIKLTAAHYVTAIRACLRVQELDIAESLLRRMDIHCTHPSPDIAVYNSILDQYAKFCSNQAILIENEHEDDKKRADLILKNVKAAHRATRILQYLINNGDDMESQALFQPNHVSYNRVLQCWSKSYDPNAVQHMWELYQQCGRQLRWKSSENYDEESTQQSTTPMNSICFDTMIKFYTDTSTLYSMQKALLLLQALENSKTLDLQPEPWHYTVIVKGLIHVKDFDTAATVLRRAMERHFGDASSSRRSCINTIPALLHSLILSWIESNQLEKASQYMDECISRQDLCKANEAEAVNRRFNIVPTLQALQAAWKGQDKLHPDKYHHIDTLDKHMKRMQLALKSPAATITLVTPRHVEPLPPPPAHNYEVTPINY